ncbi:MAG: hypothetical protein MI748_12825 [Opitutales bacterium]|nr:hypothetical protein [Opitutales bacterium]
MLSNLSDELKDLVNETKGDNFLSEKEKEFIEFIDTLEKLASEGILSQELGKINVAEFRVGVEYRSVTYSRLGLPYQSSTVRMGIQGNATVTINGNYDLNNNEVYFDFTISGDTDIFLEVDVQSLGLNQSNDVNIPIEINGEDTEIRTPPWSP